MEHSKQIFIVSLFFLLIHSALWAQSWDLSMGSAYLINQNQVDTISWQYSSFQLIEDSLQVQSVTLARGLNTSHYEPLLNYHLGIKYNFPKMNGFTLGIGSNLRYNRYSNSSTTDGIDSELISRDTVLATDFPVFEPACDQFLNSPSDAEIPANDVKISILDFGLIAELSFDLISDKVKIGTAGMLTTPVFTERLREFSSLSMEEIDGLTVCRFDGVIHDRNRTGDGFRNLKLELALFANYAIDSYFEISLGVNKSFSNTFVSHDSALVSNLFSKEEKLFPFSAFISLSYLINSDEQQVVGGIEN